MPKCDACRAESARHRCSKCQVGASDLFVRRVPVFSPQACWFCGTACAKRVWRIHKLHCTDNPTLKRHVATEMAFERILATLRRTEPIPDDAQCYICLDGGDV